MIQFIIVKGLLSLGKRSGNSGKIANRVDFECPVG